MRRRPAFTRVDRVGALMRGEIERIVAFELSSPLARHVQVTGTKLSGDMGHLRVRYVMRDGVVNGDSASDGTEQQTFAGTSGRAGGSHGADAGTPEKAQAMLERSAGYVARVLCDILQLRKSPKVVFSYDREYEQMRRVRVVLDSERKLRPVAEDGSEAAPAVDSTDDAANDAADDVLPGHG